MKKILFFISVLFLSCFAMAQNGDEEAERARELFYQKDFKNAEKLYLSAIDKGNLIALNDLGNLYYLKRDYSEAKKYFQKSIDKGGTVALFNLAEVYRIEKNFSQAEKYYLLAISKGETQSYNNLALLYSENGKIEKAIETYLKAGENGDIKGYYNLANLYFYEPKYKNLKKAEKYYLKGAEQNHQNSIRMLGFVYQELKDYKKAKEYYLKALRNNENDGILVNLGLVYNELGETKKAEETHLKAIEKGYIGSMYNLASFYKKNGKIEEAKKWYKKALENGIESAREDLEELEGEKASKFQDNVNSSILFDTITLKLVGQGLSKADGNEIELEYENFKAIGKNKKVYTEKDFQVNGKKPKIMISKIVSTKMIRNFIESDEEIQVIGFLDETNERDKGIRYKPFDVKFTENQDWVKKIYFKDGVIYIWDN